MIKLHYGLSNENKWFYLSKAFIVSLDRFDIPVDKRDWANCEVTVMGSEKPYYCRETIHEIMELMK